MTSNDPQGTAALAVRLGDEWGADPAACRGLAAAILGPRGVFLPDGLATLEGHRICEENMDASLATLRAENDRLREMLATEAKIADTKRAEISALRDALDGLIAEVERSSHGGPPAYRPDLCRCGKFNCALRAALAAAKETR